MVAWVGAGSGQGRAIFNVKCHACELVWNIASSDASYNIMSYASYTFYVIDHASYEDMPHTTGHPWLQDTARTQLGYS